MKNNPTASIVIIGNEILSGRTQDTNINYIAKGLDKLGIVLAEVRVIPDIEQKIIDTVNFLRKEYDYVFTTGGIGPTHDDITSASIAKAFGVSITQNPEALKKMQEYYKSTNLNEGRTRMTMTPEGSELIDNPISVAPGFKKENVFVMAGIPNVMQAMFDNARQHLKEGDPIISKEITIYKAESKIAGDLSAAQNAYPDVEIGSYPFVRDNRLGVTIVLRSTNKDLIEEVFEQLSEIMKNIA